jgi:saccharopine dehydrogenase-like NADP-dependent oxidoreductase
MHESKLTLQQLFYLGMNDAQTMVNKGTCTAADILQFALEQKLALQPGDRDLVVMQHQITYELNGATYEVESALVLEGKDDAHTAMATTVGLPLGIAAVMILKEELAITGLHIPVLPEIYNPVLDALEDEGIFFTETEKQQ